MCESEQMQQAVGLSASKILSLEIFHKQADLNWPYLGQGIGPVDIQKSFTVWILGRVCDSTGAFGGAEDCKGPFTTLPTAALRSMSRENLSAGDQYQVCLSHVLQKMTFGSRNCPCKAHPTTIKKRIFSGKYTLHVWNEMNTETRPGLWLLQSSADGRRGAHMNAAAALFR